MTTWTQAFSKLVFWLVLLPFFVTHLHLRYTTQLANLCLVGPSTLYKDELTHVYGMYQGSPGGSSFVKVALLPARHWPSIAYTSKQLATPTSTLLRRSAVQDASTLASQIRYNNDKWCLTSASDIFCSRPADKNALVGGEWTNDKGASITVSYMEPSSKKASKQATAASAVASSETTTNFRRNPNKSSRRNRNLEQVLQRPTTTLLLALNVLLAFVYWNRSTNPSQISKIYNKIVHEGELWRSFSGATAHLEALHLGFNMLTLYSLGMELEASYGSIPFLLYNISLIMLTTVIMMAITALQIKYTNNPSLGEQSTVGYSGVLFAWMVIASLERPETCPIPFFPTVCFSTYTISGFRINIGPLVQMMVMQFLLKRVSFVGHLAGVICGFLLHWNVLPLEYVQPCVLLPTLHLIYLYQWRHFVPVRTTMNSGEEEDTDRFMSHGDVEESSSSSSSGVDSSGRFNWRRQKREREQKGHRLLVYILNAWVVVVLFSAVVYDPWGAMLLSPVLSLVFFHCSVQSHKLLLETSDEARGNETSRLGTLWKGFIVPCILTIVSDSMSIAGWIVAPAYWQSTSRYSIIQAGVLLVVRLLVQVVALTVACKNLSDIGETGGGIFVIVFGSTVVENARVVGNAIITSLTRQHRTAFEGRGMTLKSANEAAESRTSEVL